MRCGNNIKYFHVLQQQTSSATNSRMAAFRTEEQLATLRTMFPVSNGTKLGTAHTIHLMSGKITLP
jgi:hypothetical protein